jgi:3-deoxy-D-manno-octulosonic-acid transferase
MAFFILLGVLLHMFLASWLYHVSLRGYYGLLRLASLFHPKARLFFHSRAAHAGALGAWSAQGKKVMWFHCASLGEFEQGRPILEAFREAHPDWAVVLSFYSPSGFELKKKYEHADLVCYLPLDYPGRAKAFIDKINPSIALFVKYEFWYFHLRELNKRGVKVALAAGIFRQSQPFFRWYGFFQRRMLGYFSHFFLQNQESVALLDQLGMRSLSLSGDTRFDRVAAIKHDFRPIAPLSAMLGTHKAVVLGSVWPQDRTLFANLIRSSSRYWIIAPHEMEEHELQAWEQLCPQDTLRLSKWEADLQQAAPRILLLDRIGLLSRVYAYASIAYIGGGLGKGLHNTLEAAVFGVPILFGADNYLKFDEVRQMEKLGCAFPVRSAEELSIHFHTLSEQEFHKQVSQLAADFVVKNVGATHKILSKINAWIKEEGK